MRYINELITETETHMTLISLYIRYKATQMLQAKHAFLSLQVIIFKDPSQITLLKCNILRKFKVTNICSLKMKLSYFLFTHSLERCNVFLFDINFVYFKQFNL